jgi:two-component system, LytTR family, sensor histidine kinase AgrC
LFTIMLFSLIQILLLNLNILNAVLSTMLGFVMLVTTEIITVGILSKFLTFNDFNEDIYLKLLIALPHVILMGVLIYYFNKNKIIVIPKRWAILNKSQKKNNQVEIAAILITLVILFVFYLFKIQFIDTNTIDSLFMIVFILSVLLLMYFINSNFQKKVYQIEYAFDKKIKKNTLDFLKYIKSQRHDFIHHTTAITGLLEQGNYEACKEYLNDINVEIKDLNQVLPIASPAISAMLITYKHLAKDNGIELYISANSSLSHLKCKTHEFNQIIGNLIKNSIEEVSFGSSDTSWINILFEECDRFYDVSVSNPIIKSRQYNIDDFFKEGFTSKGGIHEGLGLSSVQRIVNLYNGFIFTNIEDEEITFNIKIPKD